MKLSKSLLQAILVGITLTSTAVACSKSEDTTDNQSTNNCGENCPGKNDPHVLDPDNCPACGMG